MRIRKPLAIVIGLLTIWPFVYMLLFVLFFVVMVFSVMQHLPQQHQSGSGIFPYIVIPHVGTILLMFALMAFYIVHVFKNAALKDDPSDTLGGCSVHGFAVLRTRVLVAFHLASSAWPRNRLTMRWSE